MISSAVVADENRKVCSMKTNQIVFCVVLLTVAIVVGAMFSGPAWMGLMAIGAMSLTSLVLSLVALLRPFHTDAAPAPKIELGEAVKAASRRNLSERQGTAT